MACDEVVKRVPNSPRNDPQESDPRPGRSEPLKDSEDGVRLSVNRVVLEKDNAGQIASSTHVALDYHLARGRLLGSEVEDAVRIVPDNESHPAVT